MQFGAITNSWRQLLSDRDLLDLVGEAEARGAKHVELRQTCLGSCETGEGEDWRPVTSNLQALVEKYPGLSFNLAMALPCFSQELDPKEERFQAALSAAKLVNPDNPHLRVVDGDRSSPAWESAGDVAVASARVANLALEAARQGVVFSMENSGQTIKSMALLISEARALLTASEGANLGLCPDPTNQLRGYPDSDPVGELDALPDDMIKIVHFKQARKGEAIPTVDDGDIDCVRMMKVLLAKGYDGAAIMEIPPHENVFDNLSSSFDYLNALRA
jgi:sugar phosphate isomerase/epimerase